MKDRTNSLCDPECRDEGMLKELPEYFAQNAQDHIMIVLHQIGSHGPAYFKRYPPAFEVFRPVCAITELYNCSQAQIQNNYDIKQSIT